MGHDNIPQCGRVCAALTALVSVILFILSWGTVDPRQYAIVYDTNFREVDPTVWNNGRFFTGLGRWFVKFPRGLVTIEFMTPRATIYDEGRMAAYEALSCWTENGQQVDVELSLQVRIIPEKVMELYMQWETFPMALWHLQATVARTIKDASVTIPTELFFQDREAVKRVFVAAVHSAMDDMGYYDLIDFQLRQIILPHKFEQAILAKILAFQKQKKAEYLRQTQIIKEEILKVAVVADMDALKTITNATALGNLTIHQSRADGVKEILEARADGYANFVEELGLADDPDTTWQALNYFIWSKLCPASGCDGVAKLSGFDDSLLAV